MRAGEWSRSRGWAAPGPGAHKESQAEDHGKLHPYKDEYVRMAAERRYARQGAAQGRDGEDHGGERASKSRVNTANAEKDQPADGQATQADQRHCRIDGNGDDDKGRGACDM